MDKQTQKQRVNAILSYLSGIGHEVSSTQGYEVLARAHGYKSKHVLAAAKSGNQASPVKSLPSMIRIKGHNVPVRAEDAPPLTVRQLQELCWSVDHIIAMPGLPPSNGDAMEAYNDMASEKLTGSEVALSDIGYEHVPEVIYGEGLVAVRVTGWVDEPEVHFKEQAEFSEAWFYEGLSRLYQHLAMGSPVLLLGAQLYPAHMKEAVRGVAQGDSEGLRVLQQYARTQGANNEEVNDKADLPGARFSSEGGDVTVLSIGVLKYASEVTTGTWQAGPYILAFI